MFKKNTRKEAEELNELTAQEVLDQYEKDELNEADLEWIAGGEYVSPKVPEDEEKKRHTLR